jgi:DNA (cytosine-5)-methyltransferase 1
MEAASVAWHPLGWTPVGFSEIEPFPCAILKHRFPNTPNYGSLTEYTSWPIERGAVDLLVGGTPCQSFSVAGLRKGLADPRGNLALTFLGLADKLKPRWIVWENVPGVLSSGGGRDFGSFLGALVELGYGFAYRVLDAQHFGVPQRRRRVFVVACLGDWRAAAEVLSLREGLRGYLETGNKKRKGPAADVGASVEASGLHRTVGTLCADTHPGAYSGQDAYTGRLIPVSHWEGGDIHPTLNQAHNIGSPGYSNQELFSQKGAGLVPTPFRKSKRACSTTDNETWVPADASNTLNNFDLGDTRTTHAVVQPIAWTQNQREEVRLLGDKVGAIALPGTHQTNYIAEPVHQMPGSVAPTIGASGPPYSRTGNERVEAEALAVTTNITQSDVAGPLDAHYYKGPGSRQGGEREYVASNMAVRRLTPVECERLQGFPDNWSRISWKGKPEEECPDGPRYKACGNSMAVPVMRWIGERIAAVDSPLSLHA